MKVDDPFDAEWYSLFLRDWERGGGGGGWPTGVGLVEERLKSKKEVDNEVALDAIHYEASQVCVHRVNVSNKKLQFLPLNSTSILGKFWVLLGFIHSFYSIPSISLSLIVLLVLKRVAEYLLALYQMFLLARANFELIFVFF